MYCSDFCDNVGDKKPIEPIGRCGCGQKMLTDAAGHGDGSSQGFLQGFLGMADGCTGASRFPNYSVTTIHDSST